LRQLAQIIAGQDDYPPSLSDVLHRAVLLVRERIAEEKQQQADEFTAEQDDIDVEIEALAEVLRQSKAADPRVMMMALVHTLTSYVAFHFRKDGRAKEIGDAIGKLIPALVADHIEENLH
jgi:hypothetical protein